MKTLSNNERRVWNHMKAGNIVTTAMAVNSYPAILNVQVVFFRLDEKGFKWQWRWIKTKNSQYKKYYLSNSNLKTVSNLIKP